MPQSQWIVLLIAAGVAAIVLVRLFMVLGRKSGTETPVTGVYTERRMPPVPVLANPTTSDAPGLAALQMADKSFDAAKFLDGARTAYGLIVGAFEKGDREALKPLVSPEVLEGFAAAITERGDAPNRFRFASVQQAQIEHAAVSNGVMEITVRFTALFETVEGVGAPHEVIDRWTFNRPAKSADPNWTLVATSGETA